MAEHFWFAGLIVLSIAGIAITLVRLPGTWLVLASAIAFSWNTEWSSPKWQILMLLGLLAVLAEIVEFVASAATSKRAGASRRAMVGALVGGIAGMFVFSIPLPIIGTMIGGALGSFLGAVAGQLTSREGNTLYQSTRVGVFAAAGMAVGTVAKTMIAVLMACTTVLAVIASSS